VALLVLLELARDRRRSPHRGIRLEAHGPGDEQGQGRDGEPGRQGLQVDLHLGGPVAPPPVPTETAAGTATPPSRASTMAGYDVSRVRLKPNPLFRAAPTSTTAANTTRSSVAGGASRACSPAGAWRTAPGSSRRRPAGPVARSTRSAAATGR